MLIRVEIRFVILACAEICVSNCCELMLRGRDGWRFGGGSRMGVLEPKACEFAC
jgi:hypothetical protein